MKVVALVSGGKDSCYAMMKCIQYGREIVALANLMPADDSVDELDSFMYQTVGHQIIVSYAECMGLPLFRRRIQGSTRHQSLNYKTTPGDEVEDMFMLLNEVKRQIPSITAVSSGAIASDYQRLRVESVCSRLGLVSLAYLWKQDQSLLLQEMITNGILAITVKVAAIGLEPSKHLGKEIAFLNTHLHKLKELYGINVCGEGGEYETLTLDCPLFVNARIVLDEFQTVLHSPGSIASVGVIHPLTFHLENKETAISLSNNDKTNYSSLGKNGSVFEVQGDCPQRSEARCQSNAESTNLAEVSDDRIYISRTKKDNIFSICCWLQDSCKNSAGSHEDLAIVLKHIESQLTGYGFGWEHVLYIHLYIADMNEFATVNETYVRFITQDKCPFGVPSRSTIELPMLQASLGRAYIEVLVANDNSKNVLHVQSISLWAPSCIGPYSQATLHKEILHMAGQLGLDPATMTLCNEGPSAEMERALENSEAVANVFNCSISISAIVFTIYCSRNTPLPERLKIQEKQDSFLKQMRLLQLEKGSKCKVLYPIFLYVLVPDLPKRAFVEVKPILFVPEDTETAVTSVQNPTSFTVANCWGFQHAQWHESCIQKCVVSGKICAVILSITEDHVANICSESLGVNAKDVDYHNSVSKGDMERVSRFCVYLLDKGIMENGFSWEDTMNLRINFPTNSGIQLETVSLLFKNAMNELVEIDRRVQIGKEPIFNVVPVLGSGSSAASMNNIITCELFARKF
ncbi:PREDICTED: diphthine--ammonia ligase-like isoform X1 [Populus euphratica]|uniref:Diphthine--ammonia ligase n=1 Tax=Populus euphratica TaxID=75702 RepID=A0AAJ6UUD9_POPEU|nr:PREDICTED: diphthine--ammonia ligase-like isoform X1 [Populus euphratica]